MTKKLYYENNSITCRATVLVCVAAEGGEYDVLLDQTAIYPEGGGQPSDTGTIGSARVSHAREEKGDIWHRCDKPVAAGALVDVRADEARRMDHTQQHTGEHLFSGVAAKLFGAKNVGFHIAADVSTLDLDKPLTQEQVAQLELAVNETVQRNEPTVIRMVSAEELHNLELRKKADGLEGEIRIVYAGGVDSCTCCGTHCIRAGEAGPFKVLSSIHYKGGVRVTFLCGMRAVRSMMEDARRVAAIARRFSTKPESAVEAVIRQGDELASLKRELKERTEKLLSLRAAELLAACGAGEAGATPTDVKLVLAREDGLDMTELASLAEKLCQSGRVVAVVFSKKREQLYYRLNRSAGVGLSMKEVCLAVNGLTGGKGGGRDDSAQGSAPVKPGWEETREQLERYLKSRLRAN